MRRALAVHRLFSQTGAGWVPLLEIIVREAPTRSTSRSTRRGCRLWRSACSRAKTLTNVVPTLTRCRQITCRTKCLTWSCCQAG